MSGAAGGASRSQTNPPPFASAKRAGGESILTRGRGASPLLDLLDDAGVKAVATGPVCPNCDAEMGPTAIICVNCGFNRSTGEKLETFSDVRFEKQESLHVESDTNQILEKAEREILNAEISPIAQDFGDGSDSIVVALGALLGFVLLVVAGVTTVLVMDRLTGQVNPAFVSFVSSVAIAVLCALWITATAFRVKPIHGLACICSAFLYCPFFGFIQGRSLLMYSIIMLAAAVIGTVTGLFCFNTTPQY